MGENISLGIFIIDILLLIGFSLSSESSLRGTSDKVLNKKYDSIDGKVYEVVNGEQCYRKCSSPAVPKICTFEFTLEWWSTMNAACGGCPTVKEDCYLTDCITAGGVKRLVEVINKQLPGPAIHVCEYDFVRVEIFNNLQHGTGTSIHWHGIHQRGSQFMDGVPYFSQCPIDYKGYFLYEFQAYPAGTHFYHSHSGLQAGDGVLGTMIVRQPSEDDPLFSYYDKDLADHNIILQSWWSKTDEYTYLVTMTHMDEEVLGKGAMLVVNGKQADPNSTFYNEWFQGDKDSSRLYKNTNFTNLPVATFSVEQGLRYRFRIVHAGIKNCPLKFTFDRHRLTVIASDSGILEPIDVDYVQILAGERYDFVIHANQPVNSYFIQFSGVIDSGCGPLEGYGILNYNGFDPWLEPIEPELKLLPIILNTYAENEDGFFSEEILLSTLRSIETTEKNYDILGKPTHTLYLEVNTTDQDVINYYGVIPNASMNKISFKEPQRPLWFQNDYSDTSEYCNIESLQRQGITCTTGDMCRCTHIYQIGLGDLVEIVILAENQNSEHPMHLHGNDFYVISMGFIPYKESEKNKIIERFKILDQAGEIFRNFDRPPVKDTVGVPETGYTIIRYVADNSGWWPFHCHTDVHIEMGMRLGFIVGSKEDLPKYPTDYPICGSWSNQIN